MAQWVEACVKLGGTYGVFTAKHEHREDDELARPKTRALVPVARTLYNGKGHSRVTVSLR